MKAVVLQDYENKNLSVESRPIPRPRAGEVLIKIAAASVNPSDLVFLRGNYGLRKPLPVVPGFEASGTVVAAGLGLWPKALLGRRVACVAGSGDGTWAQYMVADASSCIPLKTRVTFEQGASLIVNPLTALNLFQKFQQGGHRAFVQTAAAGALGRMLARLAVKAAIPAVHVIRKPEQEDILRKLGATVIVNSQAPDFGQVLREHCRKLNASMAFDAVGGQVGTDVFSAIVPDGKMVVYGALSGQPMTLDSRGFIFEGKTLEGYWLTKDLKTKSLPKLWMESQRVQSGLQDVFSTVVQGRFPLEEIQEAIDLYKTHRSEGKVFLIP